MVGGPHIFSAPLNPARVRKHVCGGFWVIEIPAVCPAVVMRNLGQQVFSGMSRQWQQINRSRAAGITSTASTAAGHMRGPSPHLASPRDPSAVARTADIPPRRASGLGFGSNAGCDPHRRCPTVSSPLGKPCPCLLGGPWSC